MRVQAVAVALLALGFSQQPSSNAQPQERTAPKGIGDARPKPNIPGYIDTDGQDFTRFGCVFQFHDDSCLNLGDVGRLMR